MSRNTSLSELINYVSASSSGNVTVAPPASGFALEVFGTGRYSGALSGSSAAFTGALTGTSATFSGVVSGSNGAFTSSVTAAAATLSGSAADRLIMTRTGIGTYHLAISGDDRFSIYDPSADVERISITSTGNVGVGTTAPTVRLEARNDSTTAYNASTGTTNRILNIRNATSGTGYNAFMNFITEPNGEWYLGAVSKANYADFVFMSRDASYGERVRITSAGNVGIGTASPAAFLDISSGTTTDIFRFGANSRWGFRRENNDNRYVSFYRGLSSTPSSVWTVDGDNGNVGIGLTSIVAKLQVENAASADPTSLSSVPTTNVFGMSTSPGGMLAAGIGTTGGTHVWLQGRNVGGAGVSYPISLQPLGGNVGIGTNSPQARLDVQGSGGTINVLDNASLAANVGGKINFQGTYDSLNRFTDGGSIKVGKDNATDGAFGFYMAFNTTQNGVGGVERMRITSGGTLQVGTRSDATESTANLVLGNTNYGGYHFLDGTAYYIGQNSNFRSLRMYSGGSTGTGVNLAAGATSWGTYSDERLKTDLTPIVNAIEKVSQLRSVTGRYKIDEESTRRSFLIAQDVKEVLPEAIGEDLNSGMLEIRYTEVIPLLVASIKELKSELDTANARIQVLENK